MQEEEEQKKEDDDDKEVQQKHNGRSRRIMRGDTEGNVAKGKW